MQQYTNIHGTQPTKPPQIEVNIDTAYIRTNIIDIHTFDMPILWQYDEIQYTLEEFKSTVYYARLEALKRIEGKCSGAIYRGIDIGAKHYSFTQQAQANIKGLLIEAQQGKTAFLYAADGEPLSTHTAEQIQAIAKVMGEWINVNLAYNEQLGAWIARETDSTVLGGIDYGVSLPSDLMQAMGAKLSAVGINAAVYAGMMGG